MIKILKYLNKKEWMYAGVCLIFVIVQVCSPIAEKCKRIVELSDGEIISDKTIA